ILKRKHKIRALIEKLDIEKRKHRSRVLIQNRKIEISALIQNPKIADGTNPYSKSTGVEVIKYPSEWVVVSTWSSA
ncbi:hypothetical protein, partial [Bartonella sp. CL9QHWL]|uniref:hypothetical protein n=1 Tax=Bartonella sp. CL9QHWL TaxID=3243542 RepID=UPI0035D0473B